MGFYAAYFLLQRHPIFPVTVIPATALDRWIGFHPHATLLYLSLWLYIPLAPWLADTAREVRAYAVVMSGMCLTAVLIFFCFPTAVDRPAAESGQSLLFQRMVLIDGVINACPSLHAAFAVFSGWCNRRVLLQLGDRGWLRIVNWCWGAGILYATLATKQHVVIDLVCGVLLGGGAALGYAWMVRRLARSADGD